MPYCLNCGAYVYPERFCNDQCAEEFQRALHREISEHGYTDSDQLAAELG